MEQVIATRVTTWGNAVYLHCRNASGTETQIRLNTNQIAALQGIMPELATLIPTNRHGLVALNVRHDNA